MLMIKQRNITNSELAAWKSPLFECEKSNKT